MEQGLKMFYQAFETILFCMCIILFFLYLRNYSGLLYSLREYTNEEIVYEQKYASNSRVTYGQLISTLSNSLDYDMKVDGVTIDKNQHTYSKIPIYGIKQGDYSKTYEYDESGKIQCIRYEGMNGA